LRYETQPTFVAWSVTTKLLGKVVGGEKVTIWRAIFFVLTTIVGFNIIKMALKLAKGTQQKTVIIYADEREREPFTEWLEGLRDQKDRRRILRRLRRIEQGNFGDCKPLHDGVYELRLFFGPGYRVYFGEDDNNIVVVLSGGGKDRQEEDIKSAKSYWKEYKIREKA